MKSAPLWVLLAAFLTGCIASSTQRSDVEEAADRVHDAWKKVREDYVEKHPELPPEKREAILFGVRWVLGMTKAETMLVAPFQQQIGVRRDGTGIVEEWSSPPAGIVIPARATHVLTFRDGVLADVRLL